jgi:pimeloyl-ACP methyl ester carboxylesterase
MPQLAWHDAYNRGFLGKASHLSEPTAYRVRRASRSSTLVLNRLQYHIREWGDPGRPLLIMVHGWMDVSASFQFLVDRLKHDWHVVAPDWRGFGLSAWNAGSSYYMADYLADLDALIDVYSKDQPVRLIGHSMGGNISCLYCGVRQERIRSFINLEGLGMPGDSADQAPKKLQRWLDEVQAGQALRDYASLGEVIERLQKTNPRLQDARASFLAEHWSKREENGRYVLRADPAHKIPNPQPHDAAQMTAIWAEIKAPVLWVMARESDYAKKMDAVSDYAARLERIERLERIWIEGAGHMLHHDQPEVLARHVETFLETHDQGFFAATR